MALNTNGKNALVAGLADLVTHIGMHGATPPDAAGSGELAGVARAAVAWSAPASGAGDNTAQLTHAIGAGQTAAFYGLWGADSGGTYYGSIPRTGAGEALRGFGTVGSAGVTADAVQAAAHGLSDGHRVVVEAAAGAGLPAGLAEATLYHVVASDVDTFGVSLTSGGASVDITGQGALFWQRVVPEVFASAGDLVTAVGALDLDANAI